MSSNNTELTLRVNDQASEALKSISGLFERTQAMANALAGATQNLNGNFANMVNTAAQYVSQGAAIARTTLDVYAAVKKANAAILMKKAATTAQAAADTVATAALTKKQVMQLKVNKALALSASGTLTAAKAKTMLSANHSSNSCNGFVHRENEACDCCPMAI